MKINYFLKRISLLMSFVFLLGFTAYSQCTHTLVMNDSYGDGWNGASVTVNVNGTAVLTGATVSSGSTASATFTASTGDVITTTWTSGSWDSECTYQILDGAGVQIGSDGPSPTGITTGVSGSCPTCPPPSGITASNISGNSADISWTTGGATSWNIEYGVSGFTPGSGNKIMNVSNPYTLQNLSVATTYDVYVQDSCSSTDVSIWTGPYSFTTPVSAFPYTESFENQDLGLWSQVSYDDDDWSVNNGGTGSTGTGPSGASDGTYYIYTEASGTSFGDEFVLESPYFDFTGMPSPRFDFDFHMLFGGNTTGTLVLESTTDGITWTNEWSMTGDQGSAWLQAGPVLTSVGNTSGVKLRFKFTTGSGGSSYEYDCALDNFNIFQPVANDLAANAVLEPVPGFEMDSLMDIKFEVYNNGTAAQSGYNVAYSINGGAYVTETISATINPDTVYQHTFTTQGVFSATGNYTINAVVSNVGDSVNLNDSISYSFVNQGLPYTEDFSSGSDGLMLDGWTAINTTGNSSAYIYVDDYSYYAYSGSKYLRMYNYTASTGDLIAVMPRLYSGVSNKAMKFYVDGPGSYDLIIGVLTDPTDPATFTAVDTVTPSTLYAQYAIDFSTYTGTGEYIGFKHSLGSTYDSYYIDDIELYQPQPNDMSLLSWDAPKGIIDGSTESITVSVFNNGFLSQSNVPVKYSIDGGTTIVTETIAGPIASGDTLSYTFTQQATFASGVNYCGAVVSNSDPVPSNDSIFFDVNNFSMPYMTGFETDVDGQMPLGWTGINTTNGYVYADNYSYYAYDGSYTLHMYNSSSTSGDLIAALPKYGGTTLTDKWINFWVRGEGSDLIIGVMTDPDDAATFTGVDTITPPNGTYVQQFITLSSYTGSGKYIAFKHGLNSTYDDFNIDEFVLEVAPTGPVYTVNEDTVDMDKVRYNYPDTLMHTVSISNTGIGLLNISTPTLSGTNATNFILEDTNTYPKDLALGESLSFDVKFFGSVIGAKTANIDITAGTNTETILLNGEVFDATIDAFPYAENFDDQAVDMGWELRSNDGDFLWEYDNNTTGSSSTGPSQDVTGGYYIYSEASSPADQGDIATIFVGNQVDLTSLTSPKMNYWYHMYGSEIDTFAVEIASGGSWTLVDTIIGEQMTDETDPWMMKSIDLSSYTTIDSIKFYVIRGPGFYGDVALDNIAFGEDFSIDLGADTASCATPITLVADSGNYTYEWIDLADTSVIGTTQSMMFDTTGTYVLNQYDIGFFMGTDTINITINSLPTVSFTGLDSVYCSNYMVDTLTGVPATGTFSGMGMVNNNFDPSMAGVGTKAITYTYTDANGCTNSYTKTTIVNGIPSVDAGIDQSICLGDTATLTATATATDPYFSEYQEGSSNHKAVEIYNGTGATINLDNYKILTNYNGNAWSGMYDFPTGTTLADGDVWVIANSSSDSAGILVHADEQLAYNAKGYMMGYNGDDVRALVKFAPNGDTIIVDIIGLYDMVDPGSGWDVAGVSSATSNHTLVRKPGAGPNYGDFTASQGSDSLSSEWLVYPQNTWTYLGTHTSTIVPPVLSYSWSNGAITASTNVAPASDMSYTVTVTNSDNNCYNMDSVQVFVNALPTVDLGADFDLCNNETTTLDLGANFASYMWSTMDTTQTLDLDGSMMALGANTVYGDVVDTNGCAGSDTVVITVLEAPVVNLGNDTTLLWSHTLVLDAGAGYASYLWNNGWTNQTLTIDSNINTNNAPNIYYVDVTANNGCVGSDTIVITAQDDTGIEDIDLISVAVYPNPTKGKYFISMDGFTGDIQLEVLSVDGKVIYVEELDVHNGFVKAMDASTLSNGVYYIKLTTNNHSQMHKLIVQ